ncbi:nuclease-related domain-containing protein [Pseudoalteromonas sp. T1lg22]|uniref:nuclease-related domain-containing protein n=1 Tax=Pseudoalteromonas sp. T1lg22 TaxID=2077096 RepID=UPI000CF5FEC7|nr:nuclease-related domain-containing protein [Pseudoalteromonas sp. T1lg22]
MKWILLLASWLFSPNLLANAQYTESECILLQHQMNDFSHAQQSSPYLAAKKAYDRYCANPQTPSAKFASQQSASEGGQIISGTNTQSSVPAESSIPPKIATSVEVRTPYIPPTQVAPQSVNAFELMLSSLIPMGLWFALALLLLAAFKTVLVFKAGALGEWRVNNKLKELTKGTNLTLYENLLLYTDNGDFTEVDHLLVSPFGIFVIESKNYSGWIFGSEKQAKWTQRTLIQSHSL